MWQRWLVGTSSPVPISECRFKWESSGLWTTFLVPFVSGCDHVTSSHHCDFNECNEYLLESKPSPDVICLTWPASKRSTLTVWKSHHHRWYSAFCITTHPECDSIFQMWISVFLPKGCQGLSSVNNYQHADSEPSVMTAALVPVYRVGCFLCVLRRSSSEPLC